MEILTKSQHRALAFVAAANRGGYSPTSLDLGRWLSNPLPRSRGGSLLAGLGGFAQLGSMRASMYGTQEHPAEHLEYLGWIAGKAEGWRVTPLGQALLRAADTDEDDVRVVVLDNKDPLAYATLIGELAGMGDAFLVDPYLDLAGCADLVAHTKIARVLMGDSPGSKKHREAVAVFLSSGQYDVEVRVAPGIHDRLVIADDGLVYTIGASLNGVSRRKAITVLTPLPQAAAETMSKAIESLWPDATVLTQPQPDSAEDTGTDEA